MVMRKTFFLFLTLLLLGASAWAQPQELIRRAGDAKITRVQVTCWCTTVPGWMFRKPGSIATLHQPFTKFLRTPEQRSLSAVKFDYDPLTAFVRIEKARIIRANGDIEVLGDERVYDYPAPAWGFTGVPDRKWLTLAVSNPATGWR